MNIEGSEHLAQTEPVSDVEQCIPAKEAVSREQLIEQIAERRIAIYAFLLKHTESVDDAEDLTHQTIENAITKIDELKDPKALNSWLFSIALNIFRTSCRSNDGPNRTREFTESSLKEARLAIPILLSETTPPDIANMRAEDIQLLNEALNLIDPKFREVLNLFYFKELSYKEIAEKLDVPMGTVMNRLHRGKEKLREIIEKKR